VVSSSGLYIPNMRVLADGETDRTEIPYQYRSDIIFVDFWSDLLRYEH